MCPFCGELIPILVRLVGNDADKGYVVVTEFTSADEPVPIIEVGVEIDLKKAAKKMNRCSKKK